MIINISVKTDALSFVPVIIYNVSSLKVVRSEYLVSKMLFMGSGVRNDDSLIDGFYGNSTTLGYILQKT